VLVVYLYCEMCELHQCCISIRFELFLYAFVLSILPLYNWHSSLALAISNLNGYIPFGV
jgi:hypothetical protein